MTGRLFQKPLRGQLVGKTLVLRAALGKMLPEDS